MPGSRRAPWVTGRGVGLHSPPLSTEVLKQSSFQLFCFIIHLIEKMTNMFIGDTFWVLVFLAVVRYSLKVLGVLKALRGVPNWFMDL